MHAFCHRRILKLLIGAFFVVVPCTPAQVPSEPYAEIDRDAVNYAGPGRDAAHDLAGPEIKIGFLAPLQGPRKAEGDALLQAARLAIEDEARNPLPEGRRLVLATRDESGPWGRASSEIVRLVLDDRAVALVTSTNGGAAHLAEQVGNKVGVPVLTLSTDKTTTQINLPWIFRLGPTDAVQARAFAQDIYRERGLTRVVLVTERDHDGRVGGQEYEKAAREFTAGNSNALTPVRVAVDSTLTDPASVVKEITAQKPEALVFWTGPETATKLVAQLREASPSVSIYLCRKAAQGSFEDPPSGRCRTCAHSPGPTFGGAEDGGVWTVASRSGDTAVRESFEQRYRERTGSSPSLAAAQAYDAVRVLAGALRRSGPNRPRLRDSVAETSNFPGASGSISFDGAGNNLAQVTLVRIH